MGKLSDGFMGILLQFIGEHAEISSAEIHAHFRSELSLATLKRALKDLVEDKRIAVTGSARRTRYSIIRTNKLRSAVDVVLAHGGEEFADKSRYLEVPRF